jgi:hypothetical protein
MKPKKMKDNAPTMSIQKKAMQTSKRDMENATTKH